MKGAREKDTRRYCRKGKAEKRAQTKRGRENVSSLIGYIMHEQHA